MRIVLLGAPGAGKGTQCKKIIAEYGLEHLSSGDILRQQRAAGTELGKKAQSYMDSGALVPDDVIVGMMVDAITKISDGGFVLDGFPRTVNQARELDKALKAAGNKIDVVINLEVDDDAIARRITGRRSCPKCGAVYHVENMKPLVEGKCDNDGVDLVQRPDDTLEVVKNRLKNYHEQTAPVVGYYRENNTVSDIDANGNPDAVNESVLGMLKAFSVSQNE